MVKIGVEFTGVVKDLEGKVKILLGSDNGDKAFRVEILWPGFYRRSYCVGF